MTEPVDEEVRVTIRERTGDTLFVSAGAGSGKTSALVARVARLVFVDQVQMERIATVTFTNKAGAELRDRLREEFEQVTDSAQAGLAQAALDALDMAAIGTLHAFAQRILTAHPIEAGLPPAVEVLDEVASSIALEERWSRLQQELLDDHSIADALILGMEAGVTLRHIRQLVKLLGQDWDRIESHVLHEVLEPIGMPDMTPVRDAVIALQSMRTQCTNPGDGLHGKILEVETLLQAVQASSTPAELLGTVSEVSAYKLGNAGSRTSWPGCDPKALRDEVKDQIAAVESVRGALLSQCLRHLVHWCAGKVLAEATARRRSGRLEFHDLLVLARDLLTKDADVRATLHDTYERLLLDEFQDTDPIQIELAVRIAGGRDAVESDWKDVQLPSGRLFVVGDSKQSIYRFRRASIATYLHAQKHIGETQVLTVNFRSIPQVIEWVNAVFGELFWFVEGGQPHYEDLASHRDKLDGLVGPAVTVLGPEEHPKVSAAELRALEAADVAGIVNQVIADEWTVWDDEAKAWRIARAGDIAVLIPSRTSMPLLEEALDEAGVHFRAEAMSLVYESQEIRDLLVAARAIADPSDQLALVAALRSPLFGCGDDDLWLWKNGGGRLELFAKRPEPAHVLAGPVGAGIGYLEKLHRAARWLTPSEVLGRLVEDRRALETATHLPRTRDAWRRIRFVVDQARAWTDVSHGGLRGYLAWVAHQTKENSRASEAILPEQDVDAVRVMTVHAAKGLEFPIVILSGMSSQPNRQYGARLLWTEDGYRVGVNKDVREPEFYGQAALDEQMSDLEKIRLLYVAATRARDHLIVSLHRCEKQPLTAARMIAETEGAIGPSVVPFERDPGVPPPKPAVVGGPAPPPDWGVWLADVTKARAHSRRPVALTASGFEGTEPEVVLATATSEVQAGVAKGPRDLELPPWSKGRYGSAVGRAVHGALQSVDLKTGDGLEQAVRAQVIAEGVLDHETVVADCVRQALASDLVKRAAEREHWRETYVGAPLDGQLVEGIIDLLYREDDGSLVVVDYKTDVISAETLDAKVAFYKPQLRAYKDMLVATTKLSVATKLLFLHPAGFHMAEV